MEYQALTMPGAHTPLGEASERALREYENARLLDAFRSAGTTGEKILRAAALSFARGLEVGRAARDEDEKKPA
nr:hypothetical protein [uncultured Selenomonas sp.]